MPYCITLRSRTDTRIITGWYDGSESRWSTDHYRQKLFHNKSDALCVCRELRKLCPRKCQGHKHRSTKRCALETQPVAAATIVLCGGACGSLATGPSEPRHCESGINAVQRSRRGETPRSYEVQRSRLRSGEHRYEQPGAP
jgi:hypothetical protein